MARVATGTGVATANGVAEVSMLARVLSCAIVGLEGAIVEVEVDLAERGLFFFAMVGLPDAAVQESKERVRAAIKNSGASFWYHRIAVNLAPADLRKEGPSYDLPIAVGILMASGQIPSDSAASSSWASCRWTARSGTPMASCPWWRWRARRASRGSSFPPTTRRRLR